MFLTVFASVLGVVLLCASVAGLYFLIKRLIAYNAEVKGKKSKEKAEWDKMNIDDL